MNPAKRPISLTIIAWILIVAAASSLASILLAIMTPALFEAMKQWGVPIGVYLLIAFVQVGTLAVGGVAILKGSGWGRTLYLIAVGLTLGTSPLRQPTVSMLIVSIIIYLVIGFFLFRPTANTYFRKNERETF